MAIYRFRQFTLTGGGNAEAVVAGAVGADFFEVVRAQPALGRVFLPEEDSPGARRTSSSSATGSGRATSAARPTSSAAR